MLQARGSAFVEQGLCRGLARRIQWVAVDFVRRQAPHRVKLVLAGQLPLAAADLAVQGIAFDVGDYMAIHQDLVQVAHSQRSYLSCAWPSGGIEVPHPGCGDGDAAGRGGHGDTDFGVGSPLSEVLMHKIGF